MENEMENGKKRRGERYNLIAVNNIFATLVINAQQVSAHFTEVARLHNVKCHASLVTLRKKKQEKEKNDKYRPSLERKSLLMERTTPSRVSYDKNYEI